MTSTIFLLKQTQMHYSKPMFASQNPITYDYYHVLLTRHELADNRYKPHASWQLPW